MRKEKSRNNKSNVQKKSCTAHHSECDLNLKRYVAILNDDVYNELIEWFISVSCTVNGVRRKWMKMVYWNVMLLYSTPFNRKTFLLGQCKLHSEWPPDRKKRIEEKIDRYEYKLCRGAWMSGKNRKDLYLKNATITKLIWIVYGWMCCHLVKSIFRVFFFVDSKKMQIIKYKCFNIIDVTSTSLKYHSNHISLTRFVISFNSWCYRIYRIYFRTICFHCKKLKCFNFNRKCVLSILCKWIPDTMYKNCMLFLTWWKGTTEEQKKMQKKKE